MATHLCSDSLNQWLKLVVAHWSLLCVCVLIFKSSYSCLNQAAALCSFDYFSLISVQI